MAVVERAADARARAALEAASRERHQMARIKRERLGEGGDVTVARLQAAWWRAALQLLGHAPLEVADEPHLAVAGALVRLRLRCQGLRRHRPCGGVLARHQIGQPLPAGSNCPQNAAQLVLEDVQVLAWQHALHAAHLSCEALSSLVEDEASQPLGPAAQPGVVEEALAVQVAGGTQIGSCQVSSSSSPIRTVSMNRRASTPAGPARGALTGDGPAPASSTAAPSTMPALTRG